MDLLEEEVFEETIELTVGPEEAGGRLDVYVAEVIGDLSRSHLQKLIAEGLVTVNDGKIKANYKVKTGDHIQIQVPASQEVEAVPENIPLDILYEDADVIVINKHQGMVVHPAPGNYSGTLVNALLWHCKDLSGINGVMRPGIVHRLDKDTSGVIMAAKNDMAHVELARQMQERTVVRRYYALVQGIVVEPGGIVDAPVGRDPKDRKKMAVVTRNGKNAVTHYKVLERYARHTLLECRLETGRTHQIRVHMAYLQHPVVGDKMYGAKKSELELEGQLLHAWLLGFNHPRTREYMEFQAPLPEYFQRALD